MEKVLVIGATGTTGKHIIDLLKNDNQYEPIAMVRKEAQQKSFEERGIQTVLADLTDNVDGVTQQMHKVIFAAGSKGKALDEVDRKGAMKIVDAAKKHRIEKFVMLSSMGADAPESATDMKEYLQAKRDADEYLANSGLNYAIVRPGTLNNDMPTGKIRLDKKLDHSSGEIPRGDVAKVLVHSLGNKTRRDVFEILNGETPIGDAMGEIQSKLV